MPLDTNLIESAYAAATQSTLDVWQDHADAGAVCSYPDDTAKLCVTSGCLFAQTGALADLHAGLTALAEVDARLDVVPASSMHFTFLAVSWGLFDAPSQAPAADELWAHFAAHVTDVRFVISRLRIVPLKNALILAGIPDPFTFGARQALAQVLLESRWQAHIEARYKGYSIPPLFWHTTLARANTEFAPLGLRDLFWAYRTRTFDDLRLGRPLLMLANYNWTRRFVYSR